MNPFLRYLADKNSAHTQTDRHTPMTTRPCGLRRAGNKTIISCAAPLEVGAGNVCERIIYVRTYVC